MRFAICCFYEAYPPASGAASVTYNLAKFLPGERTLMQVGEVSETVVTEDGVRVMVVGPATESRARRVAGLARTVSGFVSEIRHVSPDVIVLEGASWAVYHWVLMRRLRRAAPHAQIVYHAHNVEYVLRRGTKLPGVRALTRMAEGGLLRGADLATAVSETDCEQCHSLYGVRPIVLPNGVDASAFAPVSSSEADRVRSLYQLGDEPVVFSGLASYGPNREALAFLLSRVMPQLVARRPRAIVAVTGGALDADAPWLRGLGLVPFRDLPGVIGACRVAVAPVFSGSGTRLKILEAMAAGVPVVATSKAAEGLPLADGTHLLLADSAADFVRAIERFLAEPHFASRLAGAARELVSSQFAWPAIVADFVARLGQGIEATRTVSDTGLRQFHDGPGGERAA